MSIKDVLEFANMNKACNLSTVEGKQPTVRGMFMWYADETGFYFHTGSMKRLYKQLTDNPNIELCFINPEAGHGGKMMRVAGKVEFVDDTDMKNKLMEERPFLKQIAVENSYDALILFNIAHGEAYFWTMEVNTHESEVESIMF